MADSNFIDYVKILCRSGKGGAGSRHFYRAKYVPKGGPDGGDGGRGGHIILRGNKNMWTLLPLKYRRHIFAGNGQSGSGGRSFGKDGDDVIVDVPCGTVVYDAETGEYLCEVTDDGQEIKLTAREYMILEYLCRNMGKVLSSSQIYEAVWNEPSFGTEKTVTVHIKNIREKIEINPKDPKYIKVVYGLGYKVEKF